MWRRHKKKIWPVLSLTVGSLFRGILDIYGTTSRWMTVYAAAGIALILTAAGMALAAPGRPKVKI